MNPFDLKDLSELTSDVLERGDEQKLREFIDKIDLYLIVAESEGGNSFPDSVFEFVMGLMDSETLLTMEGSSKLLLVFETDWVRLSEDQKQKLLVSLGKAYARFKDPMSCFIASELLGQYYCNEDALGLLRQLKKTPSVTARAFVPHGFEHIARDATKPGLQKQAIAELRSLLRDPSNEVQAEAAEALRKLSA
jgi:hypothetical protein